MLPAKPYLQSITPKIPLGSISDEYPFDIPSLRSLERLKFHADVTFFVGENGSGKSTLLEAIALGMGFNAAGGTKNVLLPDATDVSHLHQHLIFSRSHIKPTDGFFLRAESFHALSSYYDEIGMPHGMDGRSLHQCSHGEAFLQILNHKLHGDGLYIFDEPEAALSPTRQLAAFVRMGELVKDGSQFIIATHSPILMAYPNAVIYQFEGAGIRQVDYEETEHFSVTRDFLNDYKRTVHHLLK